jgi:hypothetical protein
MATTAQKSLSSPKASNPRAIQGDSRGALPPPDPIYLEQQENCKAQTLLAVFHLIPNWQRETPKIETNPFISNILQATHL